MYTYESLRRAIVSSEEVGAQIGEIFREMADNFCKVSGMSGQT